ncbi:hypothetical protein Tco_0810423 [Tanacetum coccineum]
MGKLQYGILPSLVVVMLFLLLLADKDGSQMVFAIFQTGKAFVSKLTGEAASYHSVKMEYRLDVCELWSCPPYRS